MNATFIAIFAIQIWQSYIILAIVILDILDIFIILVLLYLKLLMNKK